ncbi:MAG: hypothetical protein ABFE07_29460 [Armatimonadia bacterium]
MPEEVGGKKDVVEMVHLARGQGPALVTAAEDGNIVAIRADVELSLDNGGIKLINGNPTISASGYNLLNKVAGINLIQPKTVGVPGHGEQPNPFVLYDERMCPRIIYARLSAVGYSPAGNIAVVDQTLHFDLEIYKQQDAMNRIKRYSRFGKICQRSEIDPKKPGYFMPVLDKDFGIWLDTSCPCEDRKKTGQTEFFYWLAGVMQRQQFADRIAMGFLRRNALKHHPAIGVANVSLDGGGKCLVPVMAWRKDLSAERVRAIAEGRVVTGQEAIDIESQVISTEQMAQEGGEALGEEVIADEAGDLERRDQTISDILGATKVRPPEPAPAAEPAPPQVKREELLSKISKLRIKMGEPAWQAFYAETVTSGRSLDQFSDGEIAKFEDVLDRYCFEKGFTT